MDLESRPSGLWSWIPHPTAGGKQRDENSRHAVASYLLLPAGSGWGADGIRSTELRHGCSAWMIRGQLQQSLSCLAFVNCFGSLEEIKLKLHIQVSQPLTQGTPCNASAAAFGLTFISCSHKADRAENQAEALTVKLGACKGERMQSQFISHPSQGPDRKAGDSIP